MSRNFACRELGCGDAAGDAGPAERNLKTLISIHGIAAELIRRTAGGVRLASPDGVLVGVDESSFWQDRGRRDVPFLKQPGHPEGQTPGKRY
jgi:hypothetical protein